MRVYCFLYCFFTISCIFGNPWDCDASRDSTKCSNLTWYLNDSGEPMPWHFKPNQVEESWDLIKGKGAGKVIYLLDSKVNFSCSLLAGKNVKISYHIDGIETDHEYERVVREDYLAQLHATSMAALIAADYGILSCNSDQEKYCNEENKIVVSGVVPDAKIVNQVFYPDGDLEGAISATRIPINELEQPVRVGPEQADEAIIKVLSISGGVKSADKTGWLAFIQRQIKNNPNMLLIAAVGNDGVLFSKKESLCVMPACLSWKGKGTPDTIIRVGALNYYNIDSEPQRLLTSNYGEELVDIMSPGYVPSIDHSCDGMIAIKTSAATAIVSGAVALMASCDPDAKAEEIKRVILNTAKKYDNLVRDVAYGRVLNIYGAVKAYCLQHDDEYGGEDKDEDETDEL